MNKREGKERQKEGKAAKRSESRTRKKEIVTISRDRCSPDYCSDHFAVYIK